MAKLATSKEVTGIKLGKIPATLPMCDACVLGKMQRCDIPRQATRPAPPEKLDRVSVDIAVMNSAGIGGYNHYVVFVCHASKRNWTYLLKHRDEWLTHFIHLFKLCNLQHKIQIKLLRADGEFNTNALRAFGKTVGLEFEFTCGHSSFQNGLAERTIRTLTEMALTMLFHSGLPLIWWPEFVLTASYILNRSPHSALGGATAFKLWKNVAPDVSHFRVVGCLAYGWIPKLLRGGKVQPKAKPLVFIGYSSERKGWKLVNPVTKRVTYSRDVVFDETRTYKCSSQQSPTREACLALCRTKWHDSDNDSDDSDSGSDTSEGAAPQVAEENAPLGTLSALAQSKKSTVEAHCAHFSELHNSVVRYHSKWHQSVAEAFAAACIDNVTVIEPLYYGQIQHNPHSKQWMGAVRAELDSLQRMQTWDIVKLPTGKRKIGSGWVFKLKRTSSGALDKFKARVVARGNTQRYGIDYVDTYAPVARVTTVRIVLALAAFLGMSIQHMDVSTAFLNGILEEEVYTTPPQGLDVPEGYVCRLRRSLYGLKQSPRVWNQTLHKFLGTLGFTALSSDSCVYVRSFGKDGFFIIVVFVDDFLLASTSDEAMEIIKAALLKQYKMTDLGCIEFFLGIHIVYDRVSRKITLDQSRFTADILVRFEMAGSNPQSTPASPQRLASAEHNDPFTGPYRSAVGGLLYLALTTRPDIAYAVCALSRHNSAPLQRHWIGVQRVFRYLVGTVNYGLVYAYDAATVPSDKSGLYAFVDANWGGCVTESCVCNAPLADTQAVIDEPDCTYARSTTGFVTMFGTGPLTWRSILQRTTATSTAEAEYMAAYEVVVDVVWIRRLLRELNAQSPDATVLLEDNMGCIRLAKDPLHHGKAKHIELKYHKVRECVKEACVAFQHISGGENVSDLFTKALARILFQRFRDQLVQDLGKTTQ